MRFTEEPKLESCLRNNTQLIHEKHPRVFRTSILTAADLTNGGFENRLRLTNRPSQEDETITSLRIAKRN